MILDGPNRLICRLPSLAKTRDLMYLLFVEWYAKYVLCVVQMSSSYFGDDVKLPVMFMFIHQMVLILFRLSLYQCFLGTAIVTIG